jgi:hypothetical protein
MKFPYCNLKLNTAYQSAENLLRNHKLLVDHFIICRKSVDVDSLTQVRTIELKSVGSV